MEYLSDPLKRRVAARMLRAPHTFFLLDFDGTLVAIKPKPEMVQLRQATKKLLEKISKSPQLSVGIISGRKLDDIKSLVGIKGLVYAGNHGLELEGPDFKYTHAKTKEFKRVLMEVIPAVQPLTKIFPGTILENKEVTLTFHYRLLEPKWTAALRKEFVKNVSPWLERKLIKVMEAKKALEVRPYFNWNKGSAVRWILLHEDPASLPIYIGDDKTDENPFKALKDRGVTIRVGYDRYSSAGYFVKDHYEVVRFLSFLAIMSNSKRK